MINSHIEEQKRALPIGTYSLYSADPVHTGMWWETATVTLARWIQDPKRPKKVKLPFLQPDAKFIVKRAELPWQLPLLEQILELANDGKFNHVFRHIDLASDIASGKKWDTLRTNCRLLQEQERESTHA